MTTHTAIDLSLTATGTATITTSKNTKPQVTTHTITSKGTRKDTWQKRAHRLALIRCNLEVVTATSDLIAIEGPSYGSGSSAGTWDRAGLWWQVAAHLLDAGRPLLVVAPSQVKRFVAGKGTADKAAVAGGVARMWPDLDLPANDNEFDALGLATLVAVGSGIELPVRLLESQRMYAAEVVGTLLL